MKENHHYQTYVGKYCTVHTQIGLILANFLPLCREVFSSVPYDTRSTVSSIHCHLIMSYLTNFTQIHSLFDNSRPAKCFILS